MKTTLRTLLYLALIVWLGAEVFFPVVAAMTFTTLAGQTHVAGSIVGGLLRILHDVGLVAGIVALALFALGAAWNLYKSRNVLPPMILVLAMLIATAYSQFVIIPAMDRDQAAAGGAIDTTDHANPITQHFESLHHRSTNVEGAIILLGIAAVVFLARAESDRI